jgi:hypothetical protein
MSKIVFILLVSSTAVFSITCCNASVNAVNQVLTTDEKVN